MSRFKQATWIICLMLSATPLLAVNGGAPDGNAHPAVGFIYGTLGTNPCADQVVGCSGVLIDPTVFLTSAECAEEFANPRQFGFNLQAIWVSFDSADPFSCGAPSLVQQIAVNPAWDKTAAEPAGNVGVMVLASPATVAPAVLPSEGLLGTLAFNQPYTVVAFGDEDGGTDTSVADLARRSASAFVKRLDAEQLELSLRRATRNFRPCIGQLNEAGPVYLGATNEIVSLVTLHARGSCWTADSQRLDVSSVRDFLAGYVALP